MGVVLALARFTSPTHFNICTSAQCKCSADAIMADLSVPPESPGALSASDLSPIRRVGSNESKDGEPSSPRRVQESKSMLWESKWPGGGVESITNLHSADEERWRCSQVWQYLNQN